MDLSFLDKSPDMTPILVRLYDSHKLYGLAKDKKPIARAELTSAVTELLHMELSTRESELVADVLIELMRQAEMDLKEALAERLATVDNVPLRLILKIVNDDISVARPVLKNSPILGDMDLIYIIKSKSPEYWRAIAERKTLSDRVMDMLAETEDLETAITLVQNQNIKLTTHTMLTLSDIAQKSEKLAQPLLRRAEVTADIARALYEYVGEELKGYITEQYPLESKAINAIVDEVVGEFNEAQSTNGFMPTQKMLATAERYKSKDLLTVNLMLGTLRRGQITPFIAQFAAFSGLKPQTVCEMLAQKSGQGLAIASKALEISKADFVSIYLLTNRVRNETAMVQVKDMTKAVEYYNRVEVGVARDILKNSAESIIGGEGY